MVGARLGKEWREDKRERGRGPLLGRKFQWHCLILFAPLNHTSPNLISLTGPVDFFMVGKNTATSLLDGSCVAPPQRTSGQIGYVTPAILGIPNASERGTKSDVAQKSACWLHNPCHLGDPYAPERGTKSDVAHKWADWLHNPCHLRGPLRVTAGNKIRCGPQMGRLAI